MGDHLCTCTAHSGVKKAHDWTVDHFADLFHTTHTVKTQHVTKSRGQHCGDIDLTTYLSNTVGPMWLVLDLRIVHDRFGSSSDLNLNGHLHYPNDMDRSLNETVTDKIRKSYTVEGPGNFFLFLELDIQIGHSTLNSLRKWEGKFAVLMLTHRFKLIKFLILRCPQRLCILRIDSICLFWHFKRLVTSTSSSTVSLCRFSNLSSSLELCVVCVCVILESSSLCFRLDLRPRLITVTALDSHRPEIDAAPPAVPVMFVLSWSRDQGVATTRRA
jgi:hypothetical protein